ncbi:MAG: CHAT domain-containing protein [Clostridia bacterium]|nr:CHAT domain-containing protein [Clostridia bacterium]
MKGFRRELAALLTVCLCLLLSACQGNTRERGEEAGVSRGLLIGYDRFVTMADTSPCSAGNTAIMADIVKDFVPDMISVARRTDEPATVDGLEALIRETFREAGPGDTSWLYISTHGIQWDEDGTSRTALLLSDGESEEELFPETLRRILDRIPGRKVVILDACHSGAAVPAFRGNAYQLLVSCAPEEDSFFWISPATDLYEETGNGYFTAALDTALRASSPEQLDPDGSGTVSARECAARIRAICGVSTAAGYPEDREKPLFHVNGETPHAVRELEFDPVIRNGDEVYLPFHFTVTDPVRLEYRMVTRKNGEWDFDGGTTKADDGRIGTRRGWLSPGEKKKTIRISADEAGEIPESLLIVISRDVSGRPSPEGSHVITAKALTDKGEEGQ